MASESDRAWRVSVADIETRGFNLDLKNPNRADDLAHRAPHELVAELLKTEHEILRLLEEISDEIGGSA
jgi:type I restriction enzyme M protein